MKPLIIYIESACDGKILLTKEELEKMLTDAYEQGKHDGRISYPQRNSCAIGGDTNLSSVAYSYSSTGGLTE